MKAEKGQKPHRRISRGAMVTWSLLVLVVVAIVVMSRLKPPEEVVEEAPEKAVLVRAQVVVPRAIDDTVVLPGWVEADVSATLAVEKGGRVTEVTVDRGDAVTKGQVLLRIDGRHWEVLKKQASIELADAERDLSRWEKLKGEGAVSTSDFDAIQHRRNMAAVAAEEAAVHISQCELTSPIDGVVDARYVELGEYVSEAQSVLKVVSLDPLNVVVNVPERDVHAVKVGTVLRLSTTTQPDVTFEGCVSFVAVAGDVQANTFAVELSMENPPETLKPGMIVDVELCRSAREKAVVVPFSAVVPKRGEHIVFVVEDERTVLRVVQIDSIVGQDVVLTSGLSEGDVLVIEGQRTLQDGVLVSVAGAAPAEQE
ncbi:MAG: efflux RND transporter periplasmic adaptor subunit [Verrucomicrobia bacterium]|jgi:membrane fusion protein, multidrug efflux system|nr:efflux RND transporter periplasmic adaptor subunit [Verrucomicrobiota bacterium]